MGHYGKDSLVQKAPHDRIIYALESKDHVKAVSVFVEDFQLTSTKKEERQHIHRNDMADKVQTRECEPKRSLQTEISTCNGKSSRITGCERCRLWGKLQVLGLGTTLRVTTTQIIYICKETE